MNQQTIIDAWADMKPWVEGTLPGLARGTAIPNQVQDAGDIGACNAFNSPYGEQGGAVWGGDGNAAITLSALTIATLSGVQIQPATFIDATTVRLPFNFSVLEVDGSYGYSQPCALYDMGHKTSHTTANGNGTITQRISNNNLAYIAKVGNGLTLSGLQVGGEPTITVNPGTGGLPGWIVAIGNFFSTFHEADAMKSVVQDVFVGAGFSQTLIGLLNQKLRS
ncbi:hypothetical protein H5407_21275 [Mitsuaria sp. WAJ17]|uniref:hypothetical protein n=1 Tax=Mitsuaria sp. WAJ17 TaxID=2761452 RepID=UPI0016029C59|nr:hypothetical protein [Mitsuaria sp. WAJ17]MBB2487776.1 hypothetical protein [Mitsuaria sp. WAJ17]